MSLDDPGYQYGPVKNPCSVLELSALAVGSYAQASVEATNMVRCLRGEDFNKAILSDKFLTEKISEATLEKAGNAIDRCGRQCGDGKSGSVSCVLRYLANGNSAPKIKGEAALKAAIREDGAVVVGAHADSRWKRNRTTSAPYNLLIHEGLKVKPEQLNLEDVLPHAVACYDVQRVEEREYLLCKNNGMGGHNRIRLDIESPGVLENVWRVPPVSTPSRWFSFMERFHTLWPEKENPMYRWRTAGVKTAEELRASGQKVKGSEFSKFITRSPVPGLFRGGVTDMKPFSSLMRTTKAQDDVYQKVTEPSRRAQNKKKAGGDSAPKKLP